MDLIQHTHPADASQHMAKSQQQHTAASFTEAFATQAEQHMQHDEDQFDEAFLKRFIRIAFWGNNTLGLVALILFVTTFSVAAGASTVLLFGASVLLVWLERCLDRHHINQVGIILYSIILGAGLLGVLFVPMALPAAVITPITAIVTCMPYVRLTVLRFLIVLAWLAVIAMVLIARYLQIFPPAPWAEGIPLTFGLLHCSGLALFLLWRYHVRLTSIFERSRISNRELHSIRNELEETIAVRTLALREREARFRAISELTSDFAFYVRIQPNARPEPGWLPNALRHITNYTEPEIAGIKSMRQIMHTDDLPILAHASQAILRNQTNTFEFRILDSDRTIRWLRSYIRPELDEAQARVVGVLVAVQDITERKRYEQQIEQLANFDPLTGLANRRLYQQRAQAALSQPDAICAVLFLDLDRFKTINDTLGHEIGDELLQQVAIRLQEAIDEPGQIARIGGDEFALLLPGMDTHVAIAVAQELTAVLDSSFSVRGHTLRVTASIGIACAPQDGTQFSTLLKHADSAMYRAKRRGQSISMHRPGVETNLAERLQLEADLRQALDRNELVLYFQPICELPSQRIVRVEALVRWRHPKIGMIAPGVFIPIAEECGLIRDLDRWVMRNAMAQAATWAAQGHNLSVAINLSAHSLQDVVLTREIASLMRMTGAPPQQLIIEVTESTAMIDIDSTLQVLHQLNDLGINVAIDDFGAGHASLSRLKHLPVEILKVDRAFVAGIGSHHKDEGVLRALVTLSRGLDLTIVAEGVETEEQLAWLSDAGYNHVQGYLLSPPVPPDELKL